MDTMSLLKARKYQMLLGVTFLPKVFRYSFVVKFITVVMHYSVAVRFLFLFFFCFSCSFHKILFKYEI